MDNKKKSIIVLILVMFFILIALLLTDGYLDFFNNFIYTQVAKLIHPWLTAILRVFTEVGDLYGIVSIIILLLINKETRSFSLPVGLTVLFSHFLNQVLKSLFAIPRPNILRLIEITGFSFPSGHAMNNATLYFLLLFITLRKNITKNQRIFNIVFFSFMVFIIGFSRVYLGVHTASDILAGWLFGLALALISDLVISLRKKRVS